MSSIAIIGGGNLGSAIAQGLIRSQFCPASQLTVTRRMTERLFPLKSEGVHITPDNAEALRQRDVIILALKPYTVRDVLRDLAASFDPQRHVVISVVTGLLVSELTALLPAGIPIFRAMPNTAIALQESVTCICSQNASTQQIEYVTELFDQLGTTVHIDEKLMDAATVLGACGIAYALRFIRAATQGGIEIGFDAKTASLIAAQTVKGAAELLLKGNRHPEEEIDKVTTPMGCTIAGLNEMEHRGFSSSLIRGVAASYQKIKTM